MKKTFFLLSLASLVFLFSCSEPKQEKLTDPQIDATVGIDLNHKGMLNAAAYSPDGKFVATSGRDKSLIIWDLATKKQAVTILPESADDKTGAYEALIYGKDGKKLYAGTSSGKLIVFDTKTGKKLKVMEIKSDKNNLLDFFRANGELLALSPDNKYVILGGNKNFTMFDAESGEYLKVFKGHTGYISDIKFAPDSKTIASGARDSTVLLWDTETAEVIKKLDFDNQVEDVDYNKEGSKLAVNVKYDKKILVLDTKKYKTTATIEGTGYDMAFSGENIVVKNNYNTKIYNSETGELIKEIKCRGFEFSLSTDEKTMAASGHKGVSITNLETGNTELFGANLRYASNVYVSPTGRFIVAECVQKSGSGGPDISSFSVDTAHSFSNYHTSGSGANIMDFKGNEDVVFAEKSWGQGYFYDLTTGQSISKIEGKFTKPICITSDGSLAIAKDKENNNSYAIFDAKTGEKKQELVSSSAHHYFSGITPDDKYFVLLTMDFFKVFELPGGKEVKDYKRDDMDNVVFIDQLADGKYVVGQADTREFKISDIMTGEVLYILEKIEPKDAALSPDKKTVSIACKDWTVKTYNLETKAWNITKGHKAPVISVAYAPNSKYIVSAAEDNQTIIWDAATGKQLLTIVAFEKLGDYEGQAKDYLIVAPNGRYDGTETAINQYLYFNKAGKHISPDAYKDKCYTPNLLGKTLMQDFIDFTVKEE